MTDSLTLTQAICTRLCHDLAGPIGAVSAGVELVGGDPTQVDAETLQLIASSSAAAAQKLKFLRAALGTPATSASIKDFKATTEGYLASVAGLSGAAKMMWPAEQDLEAVVKTLSVPATQVLANLIMMAIEVVPRLRQVVILAAGQSLSVEALGEISARLDPRPDLIALVANPKATALTPKTVQPLYAVEIVTQAGGRVSVAAVDGGCKVTAHYDRS